MTILADLTHQAVLLGSIGGLLYVATITAVALTAALSNDTRRRTDARRTLQVLLRRNHRSRR